MSILFTIFLLHFVDDVHIVVVALLIVLQFAITIIKPALRQGVNLLFPEILLQIVNLFDFLVVLAAGVVKVDLLDLLPELLQFIIDLMQVTVTGIGHVFLFKHLEDLRLVLHHAQVIRLTDGATDCEQLLILARLEVILLLLSYCTSVIRGHFAIQVVFSSVSSNLHHL